MIDYKALIANLFKAAHVIKEADKTIKKTYEKNKTEQWDTTVYRDTPIRQRDESELPLAYREMRKIARSPEARSNSEAWLFYQQGRFIERLEDDKEYKGVFFRYNPTYQLMTDDQLRGYVTWRTAVRAGEVKETSTSFAYIYAYELINLIGVSDANEGYKALSKFYKLYGACDPSFNKYAEDWLNDFAAYYEVDIQAVREDRPHEAEKALAILQHTEGNTDIQVFEAICELSSYKLASSRFVKDNHSDFVAICRRVYDAYFKFYEKNRKRTLFEALFGCVTRHPYYRMFSNAVFYSRTGHRDTVYELSPFNRYIFSSGTWTREALADIGKKSSKLGDIAKSIDAIMRVKYSYKYPLKYECQTKQLQGIIEKVIEEYQKEKLEAELRLKKEAESKITIDVSMLGGIRAAAEVTREKLITEDELYNEPEDVQTHNPPQSESNGAAEGIITSNEAGLDKNEYTFVHMLLYGGDHKAFVREKGIMLSVIVDSVNEKLFEVFSDTALESDGADVNIIEDYIDELKGIVK